MNLRTILFIFTLAGFSLNAHAEKTAFKERAPYASGAAEIQPFAGGEYVYDTQEVDTRIVSKAFISSQVKRTDFSFFTADEEEALLRFKDKEIEKLVKQKLLEQRSLHLNKKKNYLWPKVVLRGSLICVPEIENSEAIDWREHLTCYDQVKGK